MIKFSKGGHSMKPTPYDKVVSQLNIQKGDTLLASSDIKKFMWNSLK